MRRITGLLIFCFFCLGSYAQKEAPLFELLSARKTGVDFNNEVVDEKDHNILIYSNYYGGGGVGVGDFNRDGLPDLFFAGNLVPDRLYLNRGDLRFEDVSEAAGLIDNGGWSSGVVVADVNRDGWPDVYLTRELYDDQPELRRNVLYINQQDGTFINKAAEYGVDDDGRTRHATFLDYDRDGDLDLFLLTQPPNPGNYSELYGTDLKKPEYAMKLLAQEDGRFTNVSAKASLKVTGFPNSVTASDLNNDGWTDLYVANDYEAPDMLFINQQDGTFREVIQSATRHTSFYSMGVDAADINRDGWLDLMVLDMVAEDNFRLKANMSGMNPDAFWKVVADGGHFQYMFNNLHLNQGLDHDGRLILSDIAQMAGVPSTDWSWSNLFADLDNDGWQDLHVTNGLMRDIRNTDAARAFPEYVQRTVNDFIAKNPSAGEVSIWDILDLDEALKLVPSERLSNYVFHNNGDLTFTKKMKDWGMDQKTFSNGSAYADLDRDGDLELIVSNINERAFIYKNHAVEQGKGHYLRVDLQDSKNSRTLLGSRVRIEYGDEMQWQELTNVRGMYSTSEQVVHFGLGETTGVDRLIVTWPDGSQTILQDLPVDQQLTLDFGQTPRKPVVKAQAKSSRRIFEPLSGKLDFVHRENNFDDYAKQVLLPHKMSQFGPALTSGDVNADGRVDLFLGGAIGQPGQIYLQDASGNFVPHQVPVLSEDELSEDMDAAFFDADGDGDLDLYVVSGGNGFRQQYKLYQDRLYLNDGQGGFSKAENALPRFRDSGGCVRPFDFDADGDLDLFVGGRHVPWDYPSPAVSRLLRNDGGVFSDITQSHAKDLVYLGLVTDAVWTDYDTDGQSELLVVGEWMPLTVFEMQKGKLKKTKHALPNTEGWWYSIAAADMDADGDEDLILGNLGLNYKYKASPKEPFEVHYTDFDENGSKDIVLSYYNFGEQYPLRGRSCSSEQVPEIKKKFKSYNLFADATLDEVYGERDLEEALNYKAYGFASLYVENQGDGRLAASPLPAAAQVSSVNDQVVTDVDGDGYLDLVLAGNLFTSEIETSRNDAGVGMWLRGDGQGAFTAVPAHRSGLYLPADVKQLELVESGGMLLLLAAVNDGPAIVYRVGTTTGQNRQDQGVPRK